MFCWSVTQKGACLEYPWMSQWGISRAHYSVLRTRTDLPVQQTGEKKYRIGKEKECFLWGTHIWMMWQARKFWLLVKQSSCQPPTWTGKAIQVEQCWIQQHNEGLGSDELKEPSQLMLLSQEKETSDNYRTPVKQPLWCTWAPHSSPTQTCSSLTVIISPSCWR